MSSLKCCKLKPVKFTKPKKIGDFVWMYHQPEYQNDFFIFNDNETDYLNQSIHSGGGNAVMRPFQHLTPQRVSGIPTGKNGVGYGRLTEVVKLIIDHSIDRIARIVRKEKYRHVYYSAGVDGRTIGTSIFSPSKSVLEYITKSLEIKFGCDHSIKIIEI